MRILIFVLLLLGTSIQAQNVLTCYDYHDFSETDCVGCGLKDSTFSGILLVKNGTIYQPLVKPIKIKTRPNILDMEDGFATRVSIYIDQITTYNTEASVLAFLRSCVAVESITIGDVTTIIHDSISNITFPLDSTIVTEGYGINVTETSPNVYNVAADTTQLVTPYDITLIDTDNQNLTLLDSVNRVFRLQIEDGNTVKFKDDVNDADFDPANEIQGITVTGSTTAVLDLTADASDASITGAGISVISRSGNAITVTSTEVDGNVSNEIQDLSLTGNTLSLSSDASTVDLSPYLDNTDSQTLTLTDSTNRVFTLGITGGNTVKFKDNVNDADFSTTNEIQTLDVTGTTTATFDLSSDASDPTITGAGISTVSVSGNAITVTSTEVDGSISNEIQTLDVTGTSTATLDLSSDASDPSITGAGISTVSVSGNAITITSTEIDGSISNEIQNLTIDSIGRVFTLGISGGNTVKFKDTGTYTVREPLRIVGATNPYIELIQDTYGDIEVSGDPMDATKSTVWNIVDSKVTSQHILNNTVGFDDIRTLAAKSVIGRAGNTVGVAGEIGATSADQVLRVNGANNVIGWGTVAAGGIADGAVTVDKIGADAVTSAKILNGTVGYADIQNVAATKLLGNSTGSPAAMQEITLGTNLSFTGTILNATGGGGGGTVTSVAATNGTGISISGSPITTSGTLTITNTAPDQTVVITGATGTYPNFALPAETGDISGVTAIAPITGGGTSGSVSIAIDTASSVGVATQYDLTQLNSVTNLTISGTVSPLTLNNSAGTDVTITAGTGISLAGTSGNATITNSSPDQTVGITGAGITNVTGTYPNFTVTSTEVGDISSVTVSAPITGGSTSGVANIALDTTSSSGAATQYDLTLKQNTLVSGTSIKTVNSNSLLGSGNVSITPESTTVGDTPTLNLSLSGVNITGVVDTSIIATQYDITSKVEGSGVATRIAFWDGTKSLSSNSNLYFDVPNSRLYSTYLKTYNLFGDGDLTLTTGTSWNDGTALRINNGVSEYVIIKPSGVQFRTNMGVGGAIGSAQYPFRSQAGYTNQPGQAAALFEKENGDDIMFIGSNGNVGIGTDIFPAQTLHVQGTTRITGSDGTSTTIMGRDADGDVSAITVSTGLSLTGNVLTASGSSQYLNPYIQAGDTTGFFLTVAQDTVVFISGADSGEATTVGDTPTIDLTLTGVNITADVKDASITPAKLDRAYAAVSLKATTTTFATSSTTAAEWTGGNFRDTIDATGYYKVELYGIFKSAATTTGGAYSIYSAGGTQVSGILDIANNKGFGTTNINRTQVDNMNNSILGTGTSNTTENHTLYGQLTGYFTSGDIIIPKFGSEIAASTVTYQAGTRLIITKLF